jgi:hypothetical protein
MSTNEETIKKFNQNAQQQNTQQNTQQQNANAAKPNAGVPPVTVNPNPIITGKMSAADIQLLQADPNTLSDEQKLRRKALETKTNLQQLDAAKAATEKLANEQAAKSGDQQRVVMNEIGRGLRAASTHPAKQWFENVPTPGGIGILLLIIFVFLLAIVPVDSSGNTRLYLMWLTLTGKTHLAYEDGNSSSTTSATTPTVATTPTPVQGQPAPTTPTPIALDYPNLSLGLTGFFNL